MKAIWQGLWRKPSDTGLPRDELDKLEMDIRAERLDLALTRWSGARPGSLLQRLAPLSASGGLTNIRDAVAAMDEIKSGAVVRAGIVKKAVEQFEALQAQASAPQTFEQ